MLLLDCLLIIIAMLPLHAWSLSLRHHYHSCITMQNWITPCCSLVHQSGNNLVYYVDHLSLTLSFDNNCHCQKLQTIVSQLHMLGSYWFDSCMRRAHHYYAGTKCLNWNETWHSWHTMLSPSDFWVGARIRVARPMELRANWDIDTREMILNNAMSHRPEVLFNR